MADETQPGLRPVRVGLLLDSLAQPAWVYRAISEVLASDVARIPVVVISAQPSPEQQSVRNRVRRAWRRLLFDLYTGFDEYWFRDRRPDPFAPSNIEPLLPDAPRIVVPVSDARASNELPESIHRQLESYDLDVVLRFGGLWPVRGRASIARFGVWFYEGDSKDPDDAADAPGFWEVLTGNPVTRSVLRMEMGDTEHRRTIYQSHASTVPLSAWKNRRELYWKNAAFVARALRDLAYRGTIPDTAAASIARTPAGPPGNLQMLGLLPRLAGRYVAAQVVRRTTVDQWFVAYRFNPNAGLDESVPDTRLGEFIRMVPPRDRIWADPFPIVDKGRHYVFIEELLFRRNRGHISVVEIDDNGNASRPELVLQTDNHLSYPFVFRWKGETFMMPESARAGDNPAVAGHVSVPIFRARSFPNDWVQETVMLEGLEVFDPTLAEIDGTWWLFCTRAEAGASTWDELHLFHGPTPFGPWKAHRGNPVKSDVRSARPAGRLYKHGTHWYRPAQNCSVRYGYGLSVNRVECLTPTEYREVEVMAIEPTWATGLIGTHTLNAAGRVTVTDGRLRRRKWSREAPLFSEHSPARS